MTIESENKTEVETPTTETVTISVSETPDIEAVAVEVSAVDTPVIEASIAEVSIPEVATIEAQVVEIPAVEAPVVETVAEVVAIAESVVETPVVEVVAIAESVAETPVVEAPVVETVAEVAAIAESVVDTPEAAVAAALVVETPAVDVPSADTSDANGAGGPRVVRTLAVGQEVKGIIKRTSEFGAFVDIGVGRDGLVHISELSTRRVAKVTDVLTEGAEATFWIKELDRDRNRISLTMIEPGTKTVRDMQKGDIVKGKVSRIMAYGAFIDIGIGRDALLHVREMGERFVPKPEDVVTVGEEIEARIIEIERRRARVDLSIKGLRPEPEPEMPPPPDPREVREAAAAQARAEEAVVEDKFADLPAMSAIEAAFKRAMGQAAEDEKSAKLRKQITSATQKARSQQEEVIFRTLKSK